MAARGLFWLHLFKLQGKSNWCNCGSISHAEYAEICREVQKYLVWCCECQQNASQKSRYDTWYMAACARFSSPKKRKGPWKGYENRFTWDIKVSTKLAKNLFVWDFFFSDQKQRDLWSLDISDHAESWSLLQKVFDERKVCYFTCCTPTSLRIMKYICI